MTATARYADIVLPTSTFFERNDVIAGGSPPFYGYLKKIVEPLYESKSPLEIATALAAHLGFSDDNSRTDEEWVREIAKGEIPDYDLFKEKAIHRIKLAEPYVPFKKQIEDPEHHPFPTPSGKIEIFSQQLADMDEPRLPPVPKYIEFGEGPGDPLFQRYPFQLITKHIRRRTHSQLETLPWLREVEEHALEISTADALSKNIADGDRVRVFNDRGTLIVPARVTERILPGVVCLPQGAWYAPDEDGVDRGGCASTLMKDDHSPGGAYGLNSCLVQVEKLKE